MRIDKFLKLSRIIKRRTVAKDAGENGILSVNGKIVKPGFKIKVGDIIEVKFPNSSYKVKVLKLKEHVRKEEADELYEVINE